MAITLGVYPVVSQRHRLHNGHGSDAFRCG